MIFHTHTKSALLAKGEVNVGEYLLRQSEGKYSPSLRRIIVLVYNYTGEYQRNWKKKEKCCTDLLTTSKEKQLKF
jgi:hypothetical protein